MKMEAPAAPLANPVQAETLKVMFALTPPARRLAIVAALLGVTEAAVFEHAGISAVDKFRWRHRRLQNGSVPSHLMVRLARAIGVPFWSLWDDEALDAPAVVLGWKRKEQQDDATDRTDPRPRARARGAGDRRRPHD